MRGMTRWHMTAALLALMALSGHSQAEMKSQMNQLFFNMSNVTDASAYQTQRRGVLAGGRVTGRTALMDESLFSLSPPSWKAGCGGIDLFNGSFSFINAEQLITLCRTIMANAAGYAFQLALDNAFPSGMKIMDGIQKKIQTMNQYLGNSCQLAQGLVNDTANLLPFDIQHKTDVSLKAMGEKAYANFFDAREQPDGERPLEEIQKLADSGGKDSKAQQSLAALKGNLLWQALGKSTMNNWLELKLVDAGDFNDEESGSDTESGEGDEKQKKPQKDQEKAIQLKEAIMSLTGTVILDEPEEETVERKKQAGFKDSATDDTQPVRFLAKRLSLKDLVHGGPVAIYDCGKDTEQCLLADKTDKDGKISLKTLHLRGLHQRLKYWLLARNGSGLVGKFTRGTHKTARMSDREQSLMVSLPDNTGAMIRTLTPLSEPMARAFVDRASEIMAAALLYQLAEDYFQLAERALTTHRNSYTPKALEVVRQSRQAIQDEYFTLTRDRGTLPDLITGYNERVKNLRKSRYSHDAMGLPQRQDTTPSEDLTDSMN